MAQQDLDNLVALRKFYVSRRRKHAAIAAADARHEIAGAANTKLEAVQASIEVIDRAIADEIDLRNSGSWNNDEA